MKFFTTLILCLGLTKAVIAQSSNSDDHYDQTIQHSQKASADHAGYPKKRWIIGAGINIVNDSRFQSAVENTDFKNYFDARAWDFSLLTVNADYILSPDFYLNAMFSRNANKESGRRLFAADLNVKYTFANILPADYWFEPYVLGGVGYSWRELSKNNRFNVNFGAGTNFWLNNTWGFNLQVAGKLTLRKDIYNYKQNTLGLLYKL